MIVPAEDMPFSRDGIVPDIIINPHAFPSRMTIGHLVECIFAKLCCMEGMLGDGTVFLPFDMDRVSTAIESHGFERYGNEILYNGKTGEQIATEILIAPTFYMRLKHMVADKMHSRSTGPHDQLTRQPMSGRSKAGGLRIGEMERDVLLSYGFSQFAKESVMERSDKHAYHVCRKCGTLAVANRRKNYSYCTDCGGNNIAIVETPYAFKLLMQELEPFGIQIRLSTEPIRGDPMEDVENLYVDGDGDEELARLDSIPEEKDEDVDSDMEGGGNPLNFDLSARNGPGHFNSSSDEENEDTGEEDEEDGETMDDEDGGEAEQTDEGEQQDLDAGDDDGFDDTEDHESNLDGETPFSDDMSDDSANSADFVALPTGPLQEPESQPVLSPQQTTDAEQTGGDIKVIEY